MQLVQTLFSPDLYYSEHPKLKDHPAIEVMRANLSVRLQELFNKEPKIQLTLPDIPTARLRTIVNQGFASHFLYDFPSVLIAFSA
jgi:hypothetical protein